jgi:lactate dehydrogenase-like 2-hydroxyacid dehydrogenase
LNPKILVITPVKHIKGVEKKLESIGDVTYLDNPTFDEVFGLIKAYNVIFTNPNKSNVYFSKSLMDKASNLSVICTASTGTTHIDKVAAEEKKIKIIALTNERRVINKISSTAEHAFALMISTLRNIPSSLDSVKSGYWNYEPFIGRQINFLNIGVVGYGRLGNLFARYCNSFKANILVYDPYKKVNNKNYSQVSLEVLLKKSDVISLHVHVNDETKKMVDKKWFHVVKNNVLIINTSRGEIINEDHLLKFLSKNSNARYSTDVLSNETTNKEKNKLRKFSLSSEQILITPHIGGMTKEAQEIAYNHSAEMLKNYLS